MAFRVYAFSVCRVEGFLGLRFLGFEAFRIFICVGLSF